jgi:hypothetical protein
VNVLGPFMIKLSRILTLLDANNCERKQQSYSGQSGGEIS